MDRYSITITKTSTETKICGKEWGPVNGNKDQDFQYTPEIEKWVSIERTIYTQNVEELDLSAVIKAINDL